MSTVQQMKRDFDEIKSLQNELHQVYDDAISNGTNENKLETIEGIKGRLIELTNSIELAFQVMFTADNDFRK